MAAYESTYDTATDVKANWRDMSACKTVPAELAPAYITEGHALAEEAKKKCAMCLVRRVCLIDAVEIDRKSQGMRAGFFFDNGKVTLDDAPDIRKEFHIEPRVRQRPRKTSGATLLKAETA